MLSSTDWASLVTFKRELETIKALYTHPPSEILVVKEWMEKKNKKKLKKRMTVKIITPYVFENEIKQHQQLFWEYDVHYERDVAGIDQI